jgi:hypothetical protein
MVQRTAALPDYLSTNSSPGDHMPVTKDAILRLLRNSGDEAKAEQAERELPDDLNFARDRDALEKLGLDPKELIGKIDGAGIPGLS